MKTKKYFDTHPFVLFWLGLLTGAVIVGFVFFYRAVNSNDYEASFLRWLENRGASIFQLYQTESVQGVGGDTKFSAPNSVGGDTKF